MEKNIYIKLNHFAVYLKHCKSTVLQFEKRRGNLDTKTNWHREKAI